MKKIRQGLIRSHTITFQEKVGSSFQHRSFDAPKEHLDFHLNNLRKMPDVVRGVVVTVKQS